MLFVFSKRTSVRLKNTREETYSGSIVREQIFENVFFSSFKEKITSFVSVLEKKKQFSRGIDVRLFLNRTYNYHRVSRRITRTYQV